MGYSLRDLLPDALRRAHITKEVSLAQIIASANEAICGLLPMGRGLDAQAISLRDGVLTINCLNASAMQRMKQSSFVILNFIKRKVPSAPVVQIRPRLASDDP